MNSMKPSTRTMATGSFMPDSPSRIRARRFFSDDPRSTEKMAALSVAETIEPSSSPSSVVRSSSHAAARPTITACATVAKMASITLVRSTGRISPQPEARPPSNRMNTSAITPIVRASSTSLSLPPKWISPSPSEPMAMARPSTTIRPGTRRLPATSDAAMPVASSAPASRRSSP